MNRIEATVSDELYVAGRTCDGYEYAALRFFVVIERADGSRIRHNVSFEGAKVICNEDTDGETFFADIREQARAKAQRLADRVNAANWVNPDFWHEIDPAYGSEAYQQQDAGGYFRSRERQEEEASRYLA